MIIDTVSFLWAMLIVVISALLSLLSPFWHKPKRRETENNECVPLSLVILAQDNANELEKNLPKWISQNYPNDLQIIVVINKGDHKAEDILKLNAGESSLQATFVPQDSRYMSRRKLAVTLGVKAARYDWVMLTQANCAPDSPLCLQTLARHCSNSNINMVMGYTHYNSGSFYSFAQMQRAYYMMRQASFGTAYATAKDCLLFRKDDFMSGQGYVGSLGQVWGEFEELVNKYAYKHSTIVECAKEGQLTQLTPTRKEWRARQIAYYDTAKHLKHRFPLCVLYPLEQFALHVNYVFILGIGIWSVLTQQWIMLGGAVMALLTTVIIKYILSRFAIKRIGEKISPWKTIPYELGLSWQKLFYRILYIVTDKREFTSHKL